MKKRNAKLFRKEEVSTSTSVEEFKVKMWSWLMAKGSIFREEMFLYNLLSI